MSNNVVMRVVDLTAGWQPLSDTDLVATVDVSVPPGNAANAVFMGDDGGEVAWIPGEYHQLVRVNLAEVLVKGTPGDVVTVVGGTW